MLTNANTATTSVAPQGFARRSLLGMVMIAAAPLSRGALAESPGGRDLYDRALQRSTARRDEIRYADRLQSPVRGAGARNRSGVPTGCGFFKAGEFGNKRRRSWVFSRLHPTG
jgi:hypothetical protein